MLLRREGRQSTMNDEPKKSRAVSRCRNVRPLLGRACAVVGLVLAMAAAGAGAEDGAGDPPGGYELVHLGGSADGHDTIDRLAGQEVDIVLGWAEEVGGLPPVSGIGAAGNG